MSNLALAIACWGAVVCSTTVIIVHLPAVSTAQPVLADLATEQHTDSIAVTIARDGKPFGHFETRLLYTISATADPHSISVVPFQDAATHHLLRLARRKPELFVTEKHDLEAIGAALKTAIKRPEISSLRLDYARIHEGETKGQ